MLGNSTLFAPSGKEDTAAELQSHVARTLDTLVDAVQNAEAVEIKEFDTIARLETQSIATGEMTEKSSRTHQLLRQGLEHKGGTANRRVRVRKVPELCGRRPHDEQALGVLITSARKAPPDVLTCRSVHARLRREVPTDHEARCQLSRSADLCSRSFGGTAARRPKQNNTLASTLRLVTRVLDGDDEKHVRIPLKPSARADLSKTTTCG